MNRICVLCNWSSLLLALVSWTWDVCWSNKFISLSHSTFTLVNNIIIITNDDHEYYITQMKKRSEATQTLRAGCSTSKADPQTNTRTNRQGRLQYTAQLSAQCNKTVFVLGGPTKVKPTYIFVRKIWIKFEWIDKIQWFVVNAITVHSHILGSIKI